MGKYITTPKSAGLESQKKTEEEIIKLGATILKLASLLIVSWKNRF